MAESVLMPRQGNTVEACTILSWKKSEGDSVSIGEVICEVETDKATLDVESTASGTLLERFFEEGDEVAVLTPIAAIGEPGEQVEKGVPSGGVTSTSSDGAGQQNDGPTADGGTAFGSGRPGREISGGIALSQTKPGPTAAGAEAQGKRGVPAQIAISPRARRIAERSGIDLVALEGVGTGPMGRVIERDVKAVINQQHTRSANEVVPVSKQTPGPRAAPEPDAAPDSLNQEFPGASEIEPVKGVRKIIAKRMHASLSDTAQLTLQASADARAVLRYRQLLKGSSVESGLRRITLNDLFLFSVSRVLGEFPEMNAHFNGDHIRRFQSVHLGFAVDTPKGLFVPVIRFAETLSLGQISAEANRLADACQDGSVMPDELAGATFTVSNLGALGVEIFTPVLNPPEVGILGVCSIVERPVSTEGAIELVPYVGLSLTIDHRALDGSPASWFLRRLREAISEFELLLSS